MNYHDLFVTVMQQQHATWANNIFSTWRFFFALALPSAILAVVLMIIIRRSQGKPHALVRPTLGLAMLGLFASMAIFVPMGLVHVMGQAIAESTLEREGASSLPLAITMEGTAPGRPVQVTFYRKESYALMDGIPCRSESFSHTVAIPWEQAVRIAKDDPTVSMQMDARSDQADARSNQVETRSDPGHGQVRLAQGVLP